MHYSFSFACPIELLNIYQQTCIILLRMNSNVESFHNVIQSSVKNTHSRMWKTDTSLKKDIMKRLVKSLFFCCFMAKLPSGPMSYAVKMLVAKMLMVEIPDRVPGIPISASVCTHFPSTRTVQPWE